MSTLTMPHTLSQRHYYGDPLLLTLAALLLAFGLVMMTSASIEIAVRQAGDPFYFFKRQFGFMLLGLALGAVVIMNPMRLWYRSSVLLLFLAYVALVMVLIPGLGRTVNGSTRWIDLPGFSLQASEVAKLFVIVFTAWFLSRHRELVRSSIAGFIYPLLLMSPVVALLMVEPDFGATVVLCSAVLGMLFLGGIRLFYLILAAGILGGGGYLAIVNSEYRLNRLLTFMQTMQNPFSDDVVFGSGYQLAQALIGFGRESGLVSDSATASRRSTSCRRRTRISFWPSLPKNWVCSACWRYCCCSSRSLGAHSCCHVATRKAADCSRPT